MLYFSAPHSLCTTSHAISHVFDIYCTSLFVHSLLRGHMRTIGVLPAAKSSLGLCARWFSKSCGAPVEIWTQCLVLGSASVQRSGSS